MRVRVNEEREECSETGSEKGLERSEESRGGDGDGDGEGGRQGTSSLRASWVGSHNIVTLITA